MRVPAFTFKFSAHNIPPNIPGISTPVCKGINAALTKLNGAFSVPLLTNVFHKNCRRLSSMVVSINGIANPLRILGGYSKLL